MDIKRHISDTAFLVNESRARLVKISQDIYAEHWVLPEKRELIRELWNDFANEVYSHDDLELSIRNRYFLDHLQKLASATDDPVFVNVGAGFTSYPFLLDRSIRCIEVDYPHVVAFKQGRLRRLQDEGILPDRDVEFLGADLNTAEGQNGLSKLLLLDVSGRPSYILLEGITYYLDMSLLNSLFRMFSATQLSKSIVAFDFWKPDMTRHPVFMRLQRFFADRFGHGERNYCLFDQEFIESIEGYQVLEMSNAMEQEGIYAGSSVLKDYHKILPENYAVLGKR